MAEKVTEMKLKVDLQCPCCYKKVKKILCKFPQIRDRVYDEKNNIVKITVICCSPEKIRDKLCCKGGKVIKSIEIVEPPPPKPREPEKPKNADKPIDPPKPPQKPKEADKPKPAEKPKATEKPKQPEKKEPEMPKQPEKPKPPPAAPASLPPPPRPIPDPGPVPVQALAIGVCCRQCYEGYPGGPCYHWYGRPAPPPPCYGSYGYQYGCGCRRGCYVGRCDCFSEENPSACAIM